MSETIPLDEKEKLSRPAGNRERAATARTRLAQEIFNGHYRAGQSLSLRQIAGTYALDDDSVSTTFAELQALGLVTSSGNFSAVVESFHPQEMQEAYEIRAALEEIAGRTAGDALKDNVTTLLNELAGMRSAAQKHDVSAFVNHDIGFHRAILKASPNSFLIRLWDGLSLDLRMRALIGKIAEELHVIAESHQPIVDVLQNGRSRQAGLLLRNHVEICCEYIKKSKSDSGMHKAIQKDLERARDVQQALFPRQALSIPSLSCETFYQPAHEVGGDYYDFLPLQGGCWGIAIGDVSGKGVGAALVMASLQASLRAQAMNVDMNLPALLENINRLVFGSAPSHFFASLFYAEYEPATRMLSYVNAGHNPPLVIRPREGSCEVLRLEATSVPVGVELDSRFASATFQLQTDDLLMAYTDGITEAENASGEFWGQERLEFLLSSCVDEPLAQIVQGILDQVSAYARGWAQKDDMTLFVIRVK